MQQNNDDFSLDDELSDLDFDSLLIDEEPDPLEEVEYKDNLQDDARAEISAVKTAFAERAQREKERYELAVDSEYWICLCFQTRSQKEEFLKSSGLMTLGDKYLDGRMAARALGYDIKTPDPTYGRLKIDRKLAEEFETI